MANLPISGLTASASNLASTDLAPVVQTVGVGPVKMTGLQLAGGLLGSTTFNGATSVGTALSTVAITGTGGQFSCAAATLAVGQNVTISGTLGGTGSITGYSSPTTYTISATNGSTTFTLVNASTGAALTTTAGTPTGLTYVITSPVVNFTQTWNNSNVTFTGLKFNATDTLSASGSLLLDLQVGGASKVSVSKNAQITAANTGGVTLRLDNVTANYWDIFSNSFLRFSRGPTGYFYIDANGNVTISDAKFFAFGSADTGAGQTFLRGPAAATLQLGAADAAAPVAQTFKVQSVVGSTPGATDVAGANFTIQGSAGRGSGAGGSIIFQVAPAGSAGTGAQNAYVTALSILNPASNNVMLRLSSNNAYIKSADANTFAIGDFNGGANSISYGIQVRPLSNDTGLKTSIGITIAGGAFGSNETFIYSDAANTLALRNGAGQPQTFNVYNTYTSAADYERGSFKWSSNVLTIASEKAGSGIARAMSFVDGGGTERINIAATSGVVLVADMQLVTSSSIGYIGAASSGFTLRYSSGANSDMMVRFTGTTSSFPALKRSSATLQVRLADDTGDAAFQCGTQTAGGTAFNVNGTGGNSIASVTNTTTGTLLQVLNSTSNPLMTVTDTTSGTLFSVQSTTAATLFSVNDTTSGTLLAVTNSSSNDVFSVADGGAITGYDDTSANVVAIRNGTSLQTLRVYGTYTSSTNYERLFAGYVSAASAFRFGTEKGVGGGTARALELQTDGTTALTIATNGNATFGYSVAVGSTATSSTQLTVTSTPGSYSTAIFRGGSTSGLYVGMEGTSGGGQILTGAAAGYGVISQSSNFPLCFAANGTWGASITTAGLLAIGAGVSSSFPALKRVSANLQVIAADNSASAGFIVGNQALATTATDGFLYIPTCAGTPTGVPTTQTGTAPLVVDSTNNKLYVYVGGAWTAMN